MNETIDLLLKRRSVSPVALMGPGPGPQELETLLKIGSRVPDHGKLAPWRFIVFEGAARERASAIIKARYLEKNPDAPLEVVEAERMRFLRAPLIIGVVSTAAAHPKIPEWEQVLSAGAVCMNVLIGAQAMGYAASWLSNWLSYDAKILEAFGLKPHEKIAGFIHIGRASAVPEDRPRPDVAAIMTRFA
jgi:nitroreductase